MSRYGGRLSQRSPGWGIDLVSIMACAYPRARSAKRGSPLPEGSLRDGMFSGFVRGHPKDMREARDESESRSPERGEWLPEPGDSEPGEDLLREEEDAAAAEAAGIGGRSGMEGERRRALRKPKSCWWSRQATAIARLTPSRRPSRRRPRRSRPPTAMGTLSSRPRPRPTPKAPIQTIEARREGV